VLEVPFQVGRQLVGRRVTFRWFLRHCLEDDGLKIRGNARVQRPRGGWLLAGNPAEDIGPIVPVKRGSKGHRLVKSYTQRIDVSAMVDVRTRAKQCLRAHVAKGADKLTGARKVAAGL